CIVGEPRACAVTTASATGKACFQPSFFADTDHVGRTAVGGQGGAAPSTLDPEDPDGLPLRALSLTDEQRAQIRVLQEAARPTLESLRQPDEAYRQARYALLQATPFQPAVARQLAQRDRERRLQLHVKRLELQHAIYHVLTPTQQAQLATWWKTRPDPAPPRRRR
ncbi:MAG: Spy/CpxP family protein refolding chaperone, partial [Blastocatellia bacterium]